MCTLFCLLFFLLNVMCLRFIHVVVYAEFIPFYCCVVFHSVIIIQRVPSFPSLWSFGSIPLGLTQPCVAHLPKWKLPATGHGFQNSACHQLMKSQKVVPVCTSARAVGECVLRSSVASPGYYPLKKKYQCPLGRSEWSVLTSEGAEPRVRQAQEAGGKW